MSEIAINDLNHYYEQSGAGTPLVFIHGAFADARIWEPQWKHFKSRHRLLRYDLRGHGRTGASRLKKYSMATFADDLSGLLDALNIRTPIVCGLSWGGSIAQALAVRDAGRFKALILAGSAVAIDLTPLDKLLCRAFFTRPAMLMTIRSMRLEHFVNFSLWLARTTQGKRWLGRDKTAGDYLKQCMLQIKRSEYLKIWDAIYGFHLLPLEKITCPTLVLNGEHESKNTFRHTQEILDHLPCAEARVVPAASHGMNLENQQAFNALVEEFVHRTV